MEALRMQAFDKNTEIISAFFTNRYYNDIYGIAKDYFAKNGGKSLTEVYANLLFAHLHDIESARPGNDSVIRDTIKALHAYYCTYMGEVPLDEFIGRIISQIVPDEFNATMGGREKDSILRDIVKQTALTVGKRAIAADMLHRIIDKRSDQVGVGILRDIGITVLRDFRASLLSKLYNSSSSTGAGAGAACSRNVVAAELYNKVRDELKKILETQVQLEAEYKKLQQENDTLKRQCANLRKELDSRPIMLDVMPKVSPVAMPVEVSAPNVPPAATAAAAGTAPQAKPAPAPAPAPPVIANDAGKSSRVSKTAAEVRTQLLEMPNLASPANYNDAGLAASPPSAPVIETKSGDFADDKGGNSSDDEDGPRIDIDKIAAEVVSKNREKQSK